MEVSFNRGINNRNSFYEGKSGSHIFIPPPTKKKPISKDDSAILMRHESLGGDGVNPFWALEMEGVTNGDVTKYLNGLYEKKYKLPNGVTMSVDNLIASVWDSGNQYIGTGIKRTSTPKKGMNHAKGFYTRKIIIPPFFEFKIHNYEEVAKDKTAGLTGGPVGARRYKSFGNVIKKDDPKFRIKEEDNGVVYSIQDSIKTALLTTLKDGDTGESSDDEFVLMDTATTSFSCGPFETDGESDEETTMDGNVVWSFLAQSKAKSSGALTGSTYALIDSSRSVAGKTYIKNIREEDGIEIIDSPSSIGLKLRLANTGQRGGIDNIKYFTAEKKSEDRPSNDPRVKDGTIEIPRAYIDPNSSHDTPELVVVATGVISNIMCGVNQSRASILDGVVKIPLATSATKNDGSNTQDDATYGEAGSGVVNSFEQTSSQNGYGIDSGIIRVPLASTEANGVSTKETSGVISGISISIIPSDSSSTEFQRIDEGFIDCVIRAPESSSGPVMPPFANVGTDSGAGDISGITKPRGEFVKIGGDSSPDGEPLFPSWKEGTLKIPLCNSFYSMSDGHDMPIVQGAVQSIKEVKSPPLDTSGGDYREDPYSIIGGEIRIPRANSDPGSSIKQTSGVITSVLFQIGTHKSGESPEQYAKIVDGVIKIKASVLIETYPNYKSTYSSVPWDIE